MPAQAPGHDRPIGKEQRAHRPSRVDRGAGDRRRDLEAVGSAVNAAGSLGVIEPTVEALREAVAWRLLSNSSVGCQIKKGCIVMRPSCSVGRNGISATGRIANPPYHRSERSELGWWPARGKTLALPATNAMVPRWPARRTAPDRSIGQRRPNPPHSGRRSRRPTTARP